METATWETPERIKMEAGGQRIQKRTVKTLRVSGVKLLYSLNPKQDAETTSEGH